MVNGTLLNFGKIYKADFRIIFDQWPKLQLGLDALSHQKNLKKQVLIAVRFEAKLSSVYWFTYLLLKFRSFT